MARPLTRRSVLLAALLAGGAASCSAASSSGSSDGGGGSASGDGVAPRERTDVSSFWDAARLHTIEATLDATELSTMLQGYADSGDKDWIYGTLVIDGTRFENVGFKLKGNSTLRGVGADSDPTTLPWRIRLDKQVDGQSFDGAADIVIRDNTTASSLNEAVALDLLSAAGLASQLSVMTSFSVNGTGPALRLALEFLDDAWMAAVFSADGILYKAESEGDYSYRGDEESDYEDVFDVEAGEEDYAPLAAFLKFLQDATDEEFTQKLSEHLEVEPFARYLALEDLMDNFDDIDGPGNNSYLYYSPDATTMTVVAWDHNLAFGAQNGAGGMGEPQDGGQGYPQDGQAGGPPGNQDGQMPQDGQAPADGQAPTDGQMPQDGQLPPGGMGPNGAQPSDGGGDDADAQQQGRQQDQQGGRGGGPGGRSGNNVLATRFQADSTFSALVTEQASALRTDLVDSGRAQEIIDARAKVLTDQATALVSADDVTSDAAQITSVLTAKG